MSRESTTHFNIQISIQRVDKTFSNAVRAGDPPRGERDVTEVLDLKIVAPDEKEAYAKAARMLAASTPEWAVPAGTIVSQTSAGTYRPS